MLRKRLPIHKKSDITAWEELIKQTQQVSIQDYLKGLHSTREAEAVNIPTAPKFQKWIVLSDVHRPFHDKALWSKVLRLISDLGDSLHGIVLAGDYLDLFTLGKYNVMSLGNLKEWTLSDEYADGLTGIQELEAVLPKHAKKCYLFGNHEHRFFTTFKGGDTAKYGKALLNPVEALELEQRGWEYKTEWQRDGFQIGDLLVIHGIYHNEDAAKKHLSKAMQNIMFGHIHKIQQFTSGDISGYCIGGLFDKNSPAFSYASRFNIEAWCNGFSIVDVDAYGRAWVDMVQVRDGVFKVGDRVY